MNTSQVKSHENYWGASWNKQCAGDSLYPTDRIDTGTS